MRHFHKILILTLFLFSSNAYALVFFIDPLYWRATETNDWGYINSETLPNQTIAYQTIDFNYSPGFRIGAIYNNCSTWDTLFSYTEFDTTTSDSATGNIQPGFLGSVTAKPSHAYLYESGQVNQSINYHIFDLDFGKKFHPTKSLTLHPLVGLIGGSINQSIHAAYQGTTSTNENITNNFSGIGLKAGIDTDINLFSYHDYTPTLFFSFAASYLASHWNIKDVTNVMPDHTVNVSGVSHDMGALTLQGLAGIKIIYKKFSVKLAYEISDWFNQSQYFDNDTGLHNNDLVLQGLTLGVAYDF